jgi:hypothetical protein
LTPPSATSFPVPVPVSVVLVSARLAFYHIRKVMSPSDFLDTLLRRLLLPTTTKSCSNTSVNLEGYNYEYNYNNGPK